MVSMEFSLSCLQAFHNAAYRSQHALGRISTRSFGVQTQKIFRSGSADHHPTDFAEVDFDAIHIFSASHRPGEQAFELAVGKMSDGFFFLPGLDVQIDAAVMVFAEFRV